MCIPSMEIKFNSHEKQNQDIKADSDCKKNGDIMFLRSGKQNLSQYRE